MSNNANQIDNVPAAAGSWRLLDDHTKEIISLSNRLIAVGSAPECGLRINAPGIEPFAAHLVYDRGAYFIQTIATSTRVTLNKKNVRKRMRIAHDDILEIGGRRFRCMSPATAVESLDEECRFGSLRELISTVVLLIDNREQDLSRELVAHFSRLLRSDASRLVIEEGNPPVRRTLACFPADAPPERFSSRAVNWASREHRTVLVHDIDWRDEESSVNSLDTNQVASVLCTPLVHGGEHMGYLYLDRLQSSPPFTSEDQALCDALAPLFAVILSNARHFINQRETIARLQRDNLASKSGLIYESTVMHQCIKQAQTFAQTSAPVLIQGETGTGKELMSRFIHNQSSRSDRPFRAVNCGAIPENLIESELFGYEKGAFTGASKRNAGLFESAQDGTVLLDEIGELPMHVQVKLLRVLQESEVTRLGGHDPVPVNVRIIAATNRNLAHLVEKNEFRQDLFFRLNVLALHLPPLRERMQDIFILAEYFIESYCNRYGLARKTLTADARVALAEYTWPGNIRELENCMQKAVLLSPGGRIEVKSVIPAAGKSNSGNSHAVLTLKQTRARAEKSAVESALEITGGNVSMASRLLQIDRAWLIKRIEEYSIDLEMYRKEKL